MIRPVPPCSRDSLVALLDDLLPAEQSESVTDHLSSCKECQREFERLAATPDQWREVTSILSDPVLRTAPDYQLNRHNSAQQQVYTAAHRDSRLAAGEFLSSRVNGLLPKLEPSENTEHLGRLENYEVQSVVGWGGMGVVLRALDTTLNRPVAIKVLHPHLAANATARRRFAREARAAAAVNHPAVVPIHSVNAEADPPYIVMAFIPGGSLQDRLDREGPLDPCEALRIGYQIADALAAAHAQGLVHRDVKPGNILLDHGQNRVMLTDFGLAQALDDATATSSGLIAGTPQYMSPEQARGESVTASSDLYSLGSVLYSSLTGLPPFRGESTLAVLRQIGCKPPRPIQELEPSCPEWLAVLITWLMTDDPALRLNSATLASEIIRDCLVHSRQPTLTPLPRALYLRLPRQQHGFSIKKMIPVIVVAGLLACLLLFSWNKFQSTSSESDSLTSRTSPQTTEDLQPSSKPVEKQPPLLHDVTRWDDGLEPVFQRLRSTITRLQTNP
jgi:serine/threonine-protein kinase